MIITEQEELLDYIRKGYTQRDIAKAKGISEHTISTRIQKIDPELVEQAKEEARQLEQEELLDYIRNGYTQEDMAKAKGVSQATISEKIKKIDPKLVEQAKAEARQAKQQAKKVTYKQMRSIIKAKIESKQINPQEVKTYREMIDEKYDRVEYEDVILLINAYIRTKQIKEALYFLNMTINNEDMLYLDVEKLRNIKLKIEHIQKKQIAHVLIRQGKSTCDIMKVTGLKEVEILQIKRDMEKSKGRGME